MKIALNTYSIRNEWELMQATAGLEPLLRLLDMLGIDTVELLDRTFASDPAKLDAIQAGLAGRGITVFSLGPHANPLTTPDNRPSVLEELHHWTDVAADRGIPMYRVSLGGGKFPKDAPPPSIDEAVTWTAEVLEPAVRHASERGVTLCIETHHKFSSNPAFQEALLDKIASPNLGFIFDVGNYETDALRWASLEVLVRKRAVKYVHAKAYAFDARGFETTLDYPRAVKILHDAGLDVPLSIEWEGKMPGPIGALKTNELCKHAIAAATGGSYEMKTSFGDEDELMDDLLG